MINRQAFLKSLFGALPLSLLAKPTSNIKPYGTNFQLYKFRTIENYKKCFAPPGRDPEEYYHECNLKMYKVPVREYEIWWIAYNLDRSTSQVGTNFCIPKGVNAEVPPAPKSYDSFITGEWDREIFIPYMRKFFPDYPNPAK